MFRIQLARLGQTMEEGTIVQWLKKEGDTLEIGEELYEVETEKAVVPVQVTRPGRVVKLIAAAGATVRVGAVLAVATDPGEEATSDEIAALAGSITEPDTTASVGAAGQRDVGPGSAPSGKSAAVPKARALARELSVDLSGVRGSGPGGVIVVEDVQRAAKDSAPAAGGARRGRRVPLGAIARSMIGAVERGWQVPQFTQVALVEASHLVLRKKNAGGGLSYMDLFLDALVSAAHQVPEAVCSLGESEVCYHAEIDVTIATATVSGLMVPVLRNAGAMTLEQRGEAWRALTERARCGRLTPDDMSGGVIALSNLGTQGVDSGTALLPPGHALIAFIGGLESRALVFDGRVEARPSVYVSITYDHRVIDGVLAARFTAAMAAGITGPTAM